MKVRNDFAFAKVVVILLCKINEFAMFEIIALLCDAVLPKWLIFLPCLILLFFAYRFCNDRRIYARLTFLLIPLPIHNAGPFINYYSSSNLYLAKFMPKDNPLDFTNS